MLGFDNDNDKHGHQVQHIALPYISLANMAFSPIYYIHYFKLHMKSSSGFYRISVTAVFYLFFFTVFMKESSL